MRSMYSIGREEAAEKLEVSTRTIDRYIRKGRLRGKRQGKRVMIHAEDLETLLTSESGHTGIPPVDTASELIVDTSTSSHVSEDVSGVLQSFFQEHVEKKDLLIQEMTYKIATLESQIENSIPKEQYQKKMFALESAEVKNRSEADHLEEKLVDANKRYERERFLTTLLMGGVVLLLVAGAFLLVQLFGI